jgi:hypothetical protein
MERSLTWQLSSPELCFHILLKQTSKKSNDNFGPGKLKGTPSAFSGTVMAEKQEDTSGAPSTAEQSQPALTKSAKKRLKQKQKRK